MSDEHPLTDDWIAPRIEALKSLELTPRRREVRRLASAMREVIDHLVTTSAGEQQLARAADQLEELAATLRELPKGLTYLGFAEAANAGAETGGLTPGDLEWYGFFDHSPIIGLANPLSPPMVMDFDDDRVRGRVRFGAAYEGPPGCVHGGYVAAIFDELLGSAQNLSGDGGMTAHLGVDYRSPTPLHVELELEAWLERREGRKIWTRGTIHANGVLTAEAEALFIAFDKEKFKALLDARNESSTDPED